jgi:hypothetical protein
MVENRLSGKSMDQRIADRLKPSALDGDVRLTKGTGPTRTVTTIHHGGTAKQHGPDAKGTGILGEDRGPANRKGEV